MIDSQDVADAEARQNAITPRAGVTPPGKATFTMPITHADLLRRRGYAKMRILICFAPRHVDAHAERFASAPRRRRYTRHASENVRARHASQRYEAARRYAKCRTRQDARAMTAAAE